LNDALLVNVAIPKAYAFLLKERARYKVVCGGRGKGASWSFARSILVRGVQAPTRVLGAREIQKTIDDSVHQLFADQIAQLNLGGHYQVLSNEIRGPRGTSIGYAGLRHNAQELKSWEGADIAWVAEATNCSKWSWNILTPTIRKDGSEIWCEFNPELDSDETWQRFVVNPPEGAIVKRLTWRDNPFFNDVLRAEKADLERRDPEEALTVWEGHTRQALKDAIYADELIAATRDGRIGKVPWNGTSPVDTYWDLGHADLTAIWFIAKVGFEWHAVDYLQESRKKLSYYLEQLQARKYLYGTHYLPHDAANDMLGAESIEHQLEQHYPRRVQVVDRVSEKVQTHNAVKTVFPRCWFDAERCADGLQGLRHYRFRRDPKSGSITRDPLHDWASDVADSFGTFALAKNLGRRGTRPQPRVRPQFVQASKDGAPSTQWMGS
jgi:phage terminase large subunit